MTKTKRKHVPYDEMLCPVRGRFAKRMDVPECTSLRGKPQFGSVPGIKRHVRAVHGKAIYDEVVWPPVRSGANAEAEKKRTAKDLSKRLKVMAH